MTKQVLPTKGNLLQLKRNYELAVLGHDLLERKKNILIAEMMAMMTTVKKLQSDIDENYRRAYLTLQRANITLGIIGDIAKAIPIDNNIKISHRSVMGVDIPTIHYEKPEIKLTYGLASTDTKFDYAYLAFQRVRDLTIELAEKDNAVFRLANAIRKTQKRANALKNVVIPDLVANIRFVSEVLEEKEREEFSRLKMIKKLKAEIS